ncbi:MAG: NAD(P)/FAD-dependent oxidoreductase [Hyphomicrobiaceae bacterium]|jgi:sulfide dehydrogenase [flavocytochrome c] flavoprotein chain|nr:NAD(P)/FAD-dependent oxidoreductase [Hyphomicrobiaceae bacterium]
MLPINRRAVVAGLAAGLGGVAATVIGGRRTFAAGSPASAKIVVIGGGPGGATLANALKKLERNITVTLIEPKQAYTTCFYSNHYIGGLRTFDSITHSYRGLKALGINVVSDTASAIDTNARTVTTASGDTFPYDRLVVAPGIDFKFDGIEGYSEAAAETMPHAWRGGVQTQLLRNQLEQMEDGGTVLLAPPRAPYRCPPGPYERACVIANYLKTSKPKSKLVIVDPKMAFSKQPVFQEAFDKHYKDLVELHLTNDIDDFSLAKVDVDAREITTKSGLKVKASVTNIIPDQKAGSIAAKSGLTQGDWCPIDPKTFKSTLAQNVYVIGDAAIATDMPKSAYSANSQAHAVTGDILADLSGKPPPPNTFYNICWSFVAPNDVVKIGADYRPGDFGGKFALAPTNAFVSQPGESAALRKTNFDESAAWYDTLVTDIFVNTPMGQEQPGKPAQAPSKKKSDQKL